jgi:hypothetical protein
MTRSTDDKDTLHHALLWVRIRKGGGSKVPLMLFCDSECVRRVLCVLSGAIVDYTSERSTLLQRLLLYMLAERKGHVSATGERGGSVGSGSINRLYQHRRVVVRLIRPLPVRDHVSDSRSTARRRMTSMVANILLRCVGTIGLLT